MYYVGVDLGATNVRAVVGDESATIVGDARARTPSGPSGHAITDAVVRVVHEACDDASVLPTSITAAGIGAMGRLDFAAGATKVPANLADGLGPIPLVEPVKEQLDTEQVYLCSDTLAGAIGEWFYTYPDVDNLVYLTISSGIGAGVIAASEAYFGCDGNAGEVGHMTIASDGKMTCGCDADGHWEAYCSGNNIPRFASTLYDELQMETSVPVERDGFSAAHLFEYAGKDEFADRVIERLAHLNTIGVANLVYAYAPEVISVGGAVALNNPEHVVDSIRDRLSDAVVVNVPEIELSKLGERTVLKGALASALTEGTGDRSKLEKSSTEFD